MDRKLFFRVPVIYTRNVSFFQDEEGSRDWSCHFYSSSSSTSLSWFQSLYRSPPYSHSRAYGPVYRPSSSPELSVSRRSYPITTAKRLQARDSRWVSWDPILCPKCTTMITSVGADRCPYRLITSTALSLTTRENTLTGNITTLHRGRDLKQLQPSDLTDLRSEGHLKILL